MTTHSPDVTYAYARLGIGFGASREAIGAVLAHARAYKYSTRQRMSEVERFVEFFAARDQLGDIDASFDLIRSAYLKKAMLLHPDRNQANREAEEQLKIINAAFALVDAIHREARDYYRQSQETREEMEKEARETTERETPPEIKAARTEQAKKKCDLELQPGKPRADKLGEAPSQSGTKYFAASVPRFIRTARLHYVPVNCIIGSWHIAQKSDVNYIFDIIMLPEREFMRARMNLGAPDSASPTLQRGGFSPPYIPKDMKSVVVPEGEANPAQYAKDYFLREFGKEGKGG